MSDMRQVVVLRNVRGIRPGTIVDVRADDAMWASKVAAGSAVYLGNALDDVDDLDEKSLGEGEEE